MKSLSLNRFATLWDCECDFEWHCQQQCYAWEPLDIDAPHDARPSCFLGNRVSFYDVTGNKPLGELTHRDLQGVAPTLMLLRDGTWVEVLSGRVLYRAGKWCMRWLCAKNTRTARMMNAGFPAFRA